MPMNNDDIRQYWLQSTSSSPHHEPTLCRNVIEFLADWNPLLKIFFNENEDRFWYLRRWDFKQMRREAPRCDEAHEAGNFAFQNRYGEALKPILNRLSLVLHGRHLFHSQRGFYGAALAGVREGDLIVAFQNTKQLHVLRDLKDGHAYIGAAVLSSQTANDGDKAGDVDAVTKSAGGASIHAVFREVQKGTIEDSEFVIK